MKDSIIDLTNDYTLHSTEVLNEKVVFHVYNGYHDDSITYPIDEVYDHIMEWSKSIGEYVRFKRYGTEEAVEVAAQYFNDQAFNDLLVQNVKMRYVHPRDFLKWGALRPQINYVEAWETHCLRFKANPPNYIAAILSRRINERPNYTDLTRDENHEIYRFMCGWNELKKLDSVA